jgi:hypothetical protein
MAKKAKVRVKDLAPKGGAAKVVRGGVAGPCDRKRSAK